MNKLPSFQYSAFDSVYVDLQDTKRLLADQSARLEEDYRHFKEQSAKSEREFAEIKQMMKETDQLQKENERYLKKSSIEFDKRMKEMEKNIGGISNSNGDMAEEYFFNAFKRNKTFVNETFEKVIRNRVIMNGTWEAEFDLLLLNGKSVVIIEVKYRAKRDNITIKKLVSRIEPFKVLFPDYKEHTIYLGVAAMSFEKRLADRLRRAGIATIHQEGKKMVVYDKEVRAF
jgi:hypothetical protein